MTDRIADPWGPRTPYGRPGLAEPLVGRLPPVVRNRMPRRLTRRPWPVRVDTSGEFPLLLTTGRTVYQFHTRTRRRERRN